MLPREVTGTEIALIFTAVTGGIATLISVVATAFASVYAAKAKVLELEMEKKDAATKVLKGNQASLSEMAHEAISDMEIAAARHAVDEGKPIPIPVVAVVAEHNSPTTEEQKLAAEAATLRARLTAAKLLLDLPARQAAPMEVLPVEDDDDEESDVQ